MIRDPENMALLDADALKVSLLDFPPEFRSVPRRSYDTCSTYPLRMPSTTIEVADAARRASWGWRRALRGQLGWRSIDEPAFTLVVLDKVLQLMEYCRTVKHIGILATIGAWRQRVGLFTELMYDAAVQNAQPPCAPPPLPLVRATVLGLIDLFYVGVTDGIDPKPAACTIDRRVLGRWWRPYHPQPGAQLKSTRADGKPAAGRSRAHRSAVRGPKGGGGREGASLGGLMELTGLSLHDRQSPSTGQQAMAVDAV